MYLSYFSYADLQPLVLRFLKQGVCVCVCVLAPRKKHQFSQTQQTQKHIDIFISWLY